MPERRGGCLQDGKLSTVRRMGAGFAAGITEALVIVTPFEVVKIRLQQQRGMSKELLKYRVHQAPGPRAAPASTAATLKACSRDAHVATVGAAAWTAQLEASIQRALQRPLTA